MRIVFIFFIAFTLLSCDQSLSVRNDLPGKWDWNESEDSCGSSAQTFRFSENGKKIIVTAPSPLTLDDKSYLNEVVYEIIDELSTAIRMKAVEESRTTESGSTVVWDLVFKDKNTFCWHRVDWPKGSCTKDLKRCL